MAIRSKTQRTFLLGFILSIVFCGLVGIYCLATGTIGVIEGRILLTTAAVGASSILALAAVVPWERRRWHPIGPLGLLAVTVSLAITSVMVWWSKSIDYEALVKAFFISIVLAVAFPHIGLVGMARLRSSWAIIQLGTVVMIVILAGQIISSIVFEMKDETWYRFIGIFSIVVACGTVSVPILHKVSALQGREAVKTTALMLNIKCPRCSTNQELGVGASKCVKCALKFRIEIEEEQCRKCGYPLYQLESTTCPECGTPIAMQPGAS
jgi:hypothetical protein